VNVGVIGTGAIATLHARAYRNLGYSIRVCTDLSERAGRAFADENGAVFVQDYRQVCAFPGIDFVDVCTLPNFRLEAVEACAETGRHVQVQKPIATTLDTARQMIDVARRGGTASTRPASSWCGPWRPAGSAACCRPTPT
jgi:UDP-N-acetyl-2-amino-2-deoxyglucuronate dehydrogenase